MEDKELVAGQVESIYVRTASGKGFPKSVIFRVISLEDKISKPKFGVYGYVTVAVVHIFGILHLICENRIKSPRCS